MSTVKEQFLLRVLHFFRIVFLIDLALFAVVAIVCLLVGWHTLPQFGQGLIWGSMLAFLAGASSVITSLGLSRSPDYQYAESVGQNRMSENVRQAMKEGRESYAFLVLAATVGVVAFAVGALLVSVGR